LIDDTIRVPIELMDEDGVAHVRAIFRRLRYVGELGPRGFDPDHILEVRGNGQSQKHTTVETTLKVAEEHEPGRLPVYRHTRLRFQRQLDHDKQSHALQGLQDRG
jgi:hypothetical protein